MKILLHVDESQKWQLALENAKNILKEGERSGRDFVIEIVANSAAVRQLQQQQAKEEGLMQDMEDLAIQTVHFMACRNALKSNQILEGNLIPFVSVVPAGVVEIAEREADGFAYVKP